MVFHPIQRRQESKKGGGGESAEKSGRRRVSVAGMAEHRNTVARGLLIQGNKAIVIGPGEPSRDHSTPCPFHHCHFVHRLGLHHSVPLSVWRGGQHISRLKGKLRQVLLVFGYGGSYASILPGEKPCAAVLQVFRIVHGGLRGQAVLPVLGIVKCGFLALLVHCNGPAGDPRVQGMPRVPGVQGMRGV